MSANKHRKLSNMQLTKKFHYHHLGLWAVIMITLIVVCNFLLYLLIMTEWGYQSEVTGIETATFQLWVIVILGLETVLACLSVMFMAKATSHRIAGAFISLQRTCESITNGDAAKRQRFRSADRLDDLENAFNEMVDKLTGKGGDGQ